MYVYVYFIYVWVIMCVWDGLVLIISLRLIFHVECKYSSVRSNCYSYICIAICIRAILQNVISFQIYNLPDGKWPVELLIFYGIFSVRCFNRQSANKSVLIWILWKLTQFILVTSVTVANFIKTKLCSLHTV